MKGDVVEKVFAMAKAYGQEHVFKYWPELDENQKTRLVDQFNSIDLDLISELTKRYIIDSEATASPGQLEPADIIPVPQTDDQQKEAVRARMAGEELLRYGKVGVILVAGGQGTRLGFDGPKGIMPIGPVSNKSIFELHSDKISALMRRYRQPLPWFIMTSRVNDAETKRFFQRHDYFGLDKKDVIFFQQSMIPAVNANGKLILDYADHIFENPDGHGGTLFALKKSGALEFMQSRGIEHVFYYQVDNVLINICDPYFLGYHVLAEAEMSAKVTPKRDPYEKVGVIGKLDGKTTVIEYSDLSKRDMEARNPDGELKYNGGSIAIHAIDVDFIEKIVSGDIELPFHKAFKKIPCYDQQRGTVTPESPNGYKFEMFIFDALPLADKTAVMEVNRSDEFSPVKNASGEDSPDSAKRDLINYHGRMLKQAGVDVPFDEEGNVVGSVEISSLYALDVQELEAKIKPDLVFKDQLYLASH
ncbi:MAG: UDPGP type 1 family protein [candidate division KSB1 bacterium]|jgi:UDP-N-acetylglucosamine/UDP-N-acetylgalactosamine diphosphorylase|nr:UDPGP type 1 family protein [candidate division KSB1 bacterium]